MKQYQALLQEVMERGEWSENRTGVRTLWMPGGHMRFDLREGFPAVTTKKLPFKSVMGELCGFLRGASSAKDFRELGCKVWDQNANENAQWLANPHRLGPDDLGSVYGKQWRSWPGFRAVEKDRPEQLGAALAEGYELAGEGQIDGKERWIMHKAIDQVRDALYKIMNAPSDRRILFHAWNCSELGKMALPPCHLLYQFHASAQRKALSLTMYLRSNDLGLGAPFNIAEGAAMLSLFARLTGNRPEMLNYFIGDAHIYENHLDMAKEVLSREPRKLPELWISDRAGAFGGKEPDMELLERLEPSDFRLLDYDPHPAISAPMAV